MTTLNWDNCEHILARKAETTGWALCVGAGTSLGPFPSWEALVKQLISQDPRAGDATSLLEVLSCRYSFDALIQAAKDVLGKDEGEFGKLLQKLLYSQLQRDAGLQWKLVVKALTAASPGQMHRNEWRAFRQFIAKSYPQLSALQLAKAVVEVARTPFEPSAILSFNAEPLFYTLIHAWHVKKSKPQADLKEFRLLDRVTKGISHREKGRIPYIFCHGLMPLEGGLKLFPQLASPEKLVFSEGEYLQLANNAFSWQASLFLGTAVLRSMVFVGLSFSDPNLRRWLAWIHANRTNELTLRGKSSDVYGHYWIEEDPQDEVKRSWIEATVRHLGVRVVWIDSWSRVGAYIDRMLTP